MPSTVTVTDEWITTRDGVPMYTKTWKAISDPPVATVVFVHGFGEHVNRYNHVFGEFQKANIEVYAFDQRGFGQTGLKNRNLGVTGGWKVATDDITDALLANRHEGVPQFLFGHSMGGGLAANYAAIGPEKHNLTGFIISAPLLSQPPETRAPQSSLYIGSTVGKVLPSFQIPVKLEPRYISRIPEEITKYEADPLIHNIGSLRGLSDMLIRPKAILKEKYKDITHPIYLTHGTSDGITYYKSTFELFTKIPSQDKTWREWEGGYHELHNDLEKDELISEYIKWILAHVPAQQ